MTLQEAKDQAARERFYKDWDEAMFSEYVKTDDEEQIIDRAMELYAESKATEAYNQALNYVIENVNRYSTFANKNEIRKLLK